MPKRQFNPATVMLDDDFPAVPLELYAQPPSACCAFSAAFAIESQYFLDIVMPRLCASRNAITPNSRMSGEIILFFVGVPMTLHPPSSRLIDRNNCFVSFSRRLSNVSGSTAQMEIRNARRYELGSSISQIKSIARCIFGEL